MTTEEPGREPEPDTVCCPECGVQARVLTRFTCAGVEYLQIRCTGSLTMLVMADQVQQARLRTV